MMQRQTRGGQMAVHAALLCATVLTLLPIIWMLTTSLKTADRVFVFPVEWLPNGLHWENYLQALGARPFGQYTLNSLLAATITTVLSVIFCSAAGYSFAHFDYPGRDLLFMLVLATLMIPFEAIAVPLFIQVQRFGWVDTYAGLILPTAISSIGIFIVRQFMLGIPHDFLECARIDGANELRIFVQIIVPLSGPALSAVAIFTFVSTWNSYLWPLLVVNQDMLRTLPLGMALFENQLTVKYNQIMAVAVVGAIPLVVLFLVLQRRFVEGVVLTGLREG